MVGDATLPAELAATAALIVQALQQQADRHAPAGSAPCIELAAARFIRVTDPSNQQPGYEGIWRNARNERSGSITFNSDGSCYAEYDLFCPSPQQPQRLIEAVTAWGRAGAVRSEPRLISFAD